MLTVRSKAVFFHRIKSLPWGYAGGVVISIHNFALMSGVMPSDLDQTTPAIAGHPNRLRSVAQLRGISTGVVFVDFWIEEGDPNRVSQGRP